MARKLWVMSDFKDVEATRKAADVAMLAARAIVDNPEATEEEGMHAALNAWDAMRLEIRAAAQHVSSTVGAFFDEVEHLREQR